MSRGKTSSNSFWPFSILFQAVAGRAGTGYAAASPAGAIRPPFAGPRRAVQDAPSRVVVRTRGDNDEDDALLGLGPRPGRAGRGERGAGRFGPAEEGGHRRGDHRVSLRQRLPGPAI